MKSIKNLRLAVIGALSVAAVAAMVSPLVAQSVPRNSYTVFSAIGDVVFNRVTLSNIMGPLFRLQPLTNGKAVSGVPLTAAAGTPAGAVGVARTAGANLNLVGTTTSANAQTNAVMFEAILPDTYIAGNAIVLTVNASVTGAGTLTPASTTMTAAVYLEANGVETVVPITPSSQQIVAAGSNLDYTLTGTGLTPGRRIVIQFTMLVTSSSGANTGSINSVHFNA